MKLEEEKTIHPESLDQELSLGAEDKGVVIHEIDVSGASSKIAKTSCAEQCGNDCSSCSARTSITPTNLLEDGAASSLVHQGARDEDAMVCFCYRLTTKMLKDAYEKYGSLEGVERHTRAGTACTGCQVVLQVLFRETPTDQFIVGRDPVVGSSCVKPGARTMKGLVIANDEIESVVYSSNAVAPQLGSCDSTSLMEYSLVDHRGNLVVSGTSRVATNETFSFDTSSIDLPRPFYGLFFLTLDRKNFGAARFNVSWRTRNWGICSTHENATTGRPQFWLPILFSRHLVDGPTKIFLALTNPHTFPRSYTVTVYNLDSSDSVSWASRLDPYCSTWLNVNQDLVQPAVKRYGQGRWIVKIRTHDMDLHGAIAGYFFSRNETLGVWSCNHL